MSDINGKVVSIRVVYESGKTFGADGEDAETIWDALTGASLLQVIRSGVQWEGPQLKEITASCGASTGVR